MKHLGAIEHMGLLRRWLWYRGFYRRAWFGWRPDATRAIQERIDEVAALPKAVNVRPGTYKFSGIRITSNEIKGVQVISNTITEESE